MDRLDSNVEVINISLSGLDTVSYKCDSHDSSVHQQQKKIKTTKFSAQEFFSVYMATNTAKSGHDV